MKSKKITSGTFNNGLNNAKILSQMSGIPLKVFKDSQNSLFKKKILKWSTRNLENK